MFDLLVSIVFVMIPPIGGLGPKAQDFVVSLRLIEG